MEYRDVLIEIAELLNPHTRFAAGDEQTCDRIAQVVKQCFKQESVQAIRMAVQDGEASDIRGLVDARFKQTCEQEEDRFWGFPVVECDTIPQGQIVVGDLRLRGKGWSER